MQWLPGLTRKSKLKVSASVLAELIPKKWTWGTIAAGDLKAVILS